MKVIHFIILASLINLQLVAQNSSRDILIKYDLMSITGDQVTNSAGIGMGTEVFFKHDRSISLDAMYIFPCRSCKTPYTSIATEETKGYLISAEFRFYLIPGQAPGSGFYAGPHILYQHTRSVMSETYDGGNKNHYQVYRFLLAAHVMAGYQLRIAGPLYFDPAMGLGARFVDSRNENKRGSDPGQHEYPYDKDFENGSEWFPGIHINLKLGLKF